MADPKIQVDVSGRTSSFDEAVAKVDRRLLDIIKRAEVMERKNVAASRSLDNMDRRFRNVAAGAKIFFSALVVRRVVEFIGGVAAAGDRLRTLEGRFQALTGSAPRAAAAIVSVFDIASRTGAGLKETGDQLARFTIATSELGTSNAEVARFTESIQKLGIIGGATMQEAAGGAIQLGQGLASGRLQGDELRAVLESMPPVARIISEEMGEGGAVGNLRKLAKEGKITADVVFGGILKRSQQIDEQFSRLPVTMERAGNTLNVEWERFKQQLDVTLGVSKAIQAVIELITDGVKEAREGLDTLATVSVFLNKLGKEIASGNVINPGEKALETTAKFLRTVQRVRAEQERIAKLGQNEKGTPLGGVPANDNEFKVDLFGGIDDQIADLRRQLSLSETVFELLVADPDDLARIQAISAALEQVGDLGAKAEKEGQVVDLERFKEQAEIVRDTASAVFDAEQKIKDYETAWKLVNQAAEAGRTPQEAARAEIEKLKEAMALLGDTIPADKLALLNERLQELSADAGDFTAQFKENFQTAITSSFTNFFQQLAEGKANFKDFARSLIADIGQIITRLIVLTVIQKIAGVGAGGGGGGGFLGSILGSAKGNVFSQGNVIPFADGGVVQQPTFFPMTAGKTGLMGEAGPEAIMPLKRGPGGKLGVTGSVPNIQIVNNGAPLQVDEQRQLDDGTIQLIVNQARDRVAQDFANSMNTGFGTYSRAIEKNTQTKRRFA